MIDISIDDLKSFRGLSAELEALQLERTWSYMPISSPNGRENIGEAHGNSVSNPTEQAFFRIEELDKKIERKTAEVADKLERILSWLDTVSDSEVRAIIHWHYLIGISWRKTCKKMYGYEANSTCAMKVKRYFEKRYGSCPNDILSE